MNLELIFRLKLRKSDKLTRSFFTYISVFATVNTDYVAGIEAGVCIALEVILIISGPKRFIDKSPVGVTQVGGCPPEMEQTKRPPSYKTIWRGGNYLITIKQTMNEQSFIALTRKKKELH